MTVRVNDTVYDGLDKRFGAAAFAVYAGNDDFLARMAACSSFTVDGGAPLTFTKVTRSAWYAKDVVTYGPGPQFFKSYTDHTFRFYF